MEFKAKVRVPRLKGGIIGVFGTRSPHCPCLIGITVAKEDNLLSVASVSYSEDFTSSLESCWIMTGVISLIFDKAVVEPTFCPMYAQLCSDLNEKLPPFPSEEPGGREITFKRVLLNNCQEAFKGVGKLREELAQMTSPEHVQRL